MPLLQQCRTPGCPELTTAPYCRRCELKEEQARPNLALRRLYRTARWRHPQHGLRTQVLREEPLCPECQALGYYRVTSDVHHKQKATPANFFDRTNLQALCTQHHSQHTQRGE